MTTATCQCERCGKQLQMGGSKNPDARLLRRAESPQGYCAGCAATQFLKCTGPLGEVLSQMGPEMLRAPHVQTQFRAVMQSGGADAAFEEIDWERVIAYWHLPVAGEKKARRQMGLDL